MCYPVRLARHGVSAMCASGAFGIRAAPLCSLSRWSFVDPVDDHNTKPGQSAVLWCALILNLAVTNYGASTPPKVKPQKVLASVLHVKMTQPKVPTRGTGTAGIRNSACLPLSQYRSALFAEWLLQIRLRTRSGQQCAGLTGCGCASNSICFPRCMPVSTSISIPI